MVCGVTRCGRVHAAQVTTQITHQVPRLKAVEQAEQKATACCLRLAPNPLGESVSDMRC